MYLRTVGRYDRTTGTYSLAGLGPAREDPYGTSSMSVQISRSGNHVSIKNRYNHTVNSPDDTYDNNLDNIAYGLRSAIYNRVGRMDLMDNAPRELLRNGYVRDNDGGIHPYLIEEDNIYYGHYESIHNGEVRKLPESEYFQLDYHTYVKKGGSGEVIDLMPSDGRSNLYDETKFTQEDDGTCSVVFLKDGEPVYTYSYNEDKKHNLVGLAMVLYKGAKIGGIWDHHVLSNLTISKGATTGSIRNNPALSSLIIGEGAKVGLIWGNRTLSNLIIGKSSKIVDIGDNHPDIIITDLRKDKN
jgi:hypothetical protein